MTISLYHCAKHFYFTYLSTHLFVLYNFYLLVSHLLIGVFGR